MMAYHQAKHKSKVCQTFNIARSTLDEWIKLEKETQSLQPLPKVSIGRPFTIKDMQSFEAFVKATPFSKISDLLEPFEQKFGYQISYAVLWRGLKKIGYMQQKKELRNKVLKVYE